MVLTITQLNSQAELGMRPQRFLRWLRELKALGLPVIERGKLRGVEASVALEAMRRDVAVRKVAPVPVDELEELRLRAGLRRVVGARR